MRSLVGGMGMLYLVYGLIMAAVYLAWGLPYEGRGFLLSLANATFGGVNVVVAGALLSRENSRENQRE